MDVRDREIAAMESVRRALEPLSFDERKRVLDWATERFIESVRIGWTTEQRERFMAEMKQMEELAKGEGVTAREWMQAQAAKREKEGVAPVDIRTAT